LRPVGKYRAKITPPADLANGKAESIKVQMEAAETLLDTAATPAADPLGVGVGGIVAVTAGRQVAPNLPASISRPGTAR
jgi:hypothetical protein